MATRAWPAWAASWFTPTCDTGTDFAPVAPRKSLTPPVLVPAASPVCVRRPTTINANSVSSERATTALPPLSRGRAFLDPPFDAAPPFEPPPFAAAPPFDAIATPHLPGSPALSGVIGHAHFRAMTSVFRLG